jgi:hypothetical protein
VLSPDETALAMLNCGKGLRIVPQAPHLLEEPGTLEIVVRHARD